MFTAHRCTQITMLRMCLRHVHFTALLYTTVPPAGFHSAGNGHGRPYLTEHRLIVPAHSRAAAKALAGPFYPPCSYPMVVGYGRSLGHNPHAKVG